jgi:hypothetical protein
MKRHGHTERLSRSDSSNDDKEESSDHHYHFVDIKVKGEDEGKLRRRRLRSFNALYIFSPRVYFRVRRGPLYHDDCVCSVQQKQGEKGGVWVPVNLVFCQ